MERRPDNPLFEHIKNKDREYTSGLEAQARMLAMKDPLKYLKHQAIGSSYMNCSYDLTVGIDPEGDGIKSKLLLYNIRDYDIPDDDLTPSELELLTRVYGSDWRSKIDLLE